MDDNIVKSMLEKLKASIPVNQDLKKELRQSFKPVRKTSALKRFAAIAAAAAIICTGVFTFNDRFAEEVSAASLKISNYISLVDLGEGQNLGIAEYEGVIYTPVFGKGVYVYDKTGYHRIYDKEVNFISISRDGKKLAMSTGGTLQIYDIKSGSVTELLKPDNEETYYEQPSWSEDGNKIIFTKKVIEFGEPHGFTEKESGIYEIQIDTKNISKITDGSSPSYVKGKDAIIFERDGKVIIHKLKDGSENIIDSGRYPSVSPDGNYAAYVKTEESIRDADVSKNAKVQESIANVWIADTSGSGNKKQVTSNFPQKSMDIDEWLRGLKPMDIPQVLSIEGQYYYYNPVWSSDSKALYALKNQNNVKDNEQSMRLIRIDFTHEKLSREDTVKSFIQALIMRDDDYAKSIMKSPPELLTISNPRAVGLKITARGKEEVRDYIDAEVYLQYTANPYFQSEKSRYYLSEGETGYKIDEIKSLSRLEVFSRDDGDIYYSSSDVKPKGEVLLKAVDIPPQYLPKGKYRISNLYYNDEKGSLVFTVQGLDEDSSLKVLTYNLSSRKIRLIDSIDKATGISLTTDNNFKYAALDYYYDNDYKRPSTNIYNLDSNSIISLYSLLDDPEISRVKTDYWDGDRLVFEIGKDGQAVKFIYYPHMKGLEKF